jgi:CCDC81-like prokaryotic HU domain 1
MIVLMQNQVYSRYVYQMLMLYGRVAIPSLGTFTLHPVTAAFNNDRSKLSPPATQISFNNTVVEEVLFERQLIDAGMKMTDAAQMQASLVADYVVALSKKQDFHLGAFGIITSDGFVEKEEGIFNRYQGLESISVSALPTYLKRNSDFVKVPDAPIILPTPPATQKNNYFWPIVWILIIMILFLIWFFTKDRIADKPSIDHGKSDTEMTNTSTLNDDSLLSEIDSILENNVQAPKDTTSLKNVATETAQGTDSLDRNTATTTPSKSCIVIIGAFKKEYNAKKLIKHIQTKGYKTYSQMHNGFKRVGVSYDCIAKNPDLFKSDMQKEFNKDAWHLHDTI